LPSYDDYMKDKQNEAILVSNNDDETNIPLLTIHQNKWFHRNPCKKQFFFLILCNRFFFDSSVSQKLVLCDITAVWYKQNPIWNLNDGRILSANYNRWRKHTFC
jgi:hypothetical protein